MSRRMGGRLDLRNCIEKVNLGHFNLVRSITTMRNVFTNCRALDQISSKEDHAFNLAYSRQSSSCDKLVSQTGTTPTLLYSHYRIHGEQNTQENVISKARKRTRSVNRRRAQAIAA